jgi:hypothetical protein
MVDPERGALNLVRIIAVAFLGAGVISVVLYYLECSAHHTPSRLLVGIWRAWPFLLGIIGLIKSKALASWLSDLLDL